LHLPLCRHLLCAPMSFEVASHVTCVRADCSDRMSQLVFAAAELGAPVTHQVLRQG